MEERQKRFGVVEKEIIQDFKLKKRKERVVNADLSVKYYFKKNDCDLLQRRKERFNIDGDEDKLKKRAERFNLNEIDLKSKNHMNRKNNQIRRVRNRRRYN